MGERVQKSSEKMVKTTKKITTKVYILAVTDMVLHADTDAKKALIHETITENNKQQPHEAQSTVSNKCRTASLSPSSRFSC